MSLLEVWVGAGGGRFADLPSPVWVKVTVVEERLTPRARDTTMGTMERLIEYLNTGETIALVGAGVSAELGIPSWAALAESLLSELPAPVAAKRTEEATRLFEARRYAELCGWFAREFGDDALYERCERVLKDTGRFGVVAEFLAQWPFKAVFTTNFDESLKRHFDRAGRAVSVFGNSQRDLASVDIDGLNCLVKVHGDFGNTASIVLTDSQYARARSAGEFEYLREFLRGYFTTKRFLIVGYSLSDPDISLFLEQVAQNLRRPTPIFAVLADAKSEDCTQLAMRYNIQVVSYRNTHGDHAELRRMFTALSSFVDEARPRRADPSLDLKRAQALYFWSKFGLSKEGTAARIDAIKSILLYELLDGPKTVASIILSLGALVGVPPAQVSEFTKKAIESLEGSGQIVLKGDDLEVTPAAAIEVRAAADQHGRLRQQFNDQIRIDLDGEWSDCSAEKRAAALSLVAEALFETFDERGVEIVNAIFGKTGIASRRSVRLFTTLSRIGEGLGSEDLKFRFVSYMVELLTNPRPAQQSYLEHLALAFFSINALQMDPEGTRFRREYLSGRSLLVDSNILIPLLPLGGVLRSEFDELVSMANTETVPLLTTPGFIEDVFRHGIWAQELVIAKGEQSVEVLHAAQGEGFRRNAFLDGFVRHSVSDEKLTFENYLRACVGGEPFTRDAIAAQLEKQWQIKLFVFQTLADIRQEAFVDRDETEQFIRESAVENLVDKTEGRVQTEAEAYAIVANWDAQLSPEDDSPVATNDVAVLSQGGFLNRIAFAGPRPIGRYITVPPDALYAFLVNNGAEAKSKFSFRELIVSPLFDTTSHFVDKQKYRQFFSHLINDAERIYLEQLPAFREQVDSNLRPEFLNDIEPLERPSVLFSLQARLQDSLEGELEQERLKIVTLTQELESVLERERLNTASLEQQLGAAHQTTKKQAKLIRNIDLATERKKKKKRNREGKGKKG